MKKLVFTYSFSIIFLVTLLVVVSLLVRPIMQSVAHELLSIQEKYIEQLENSFGLSLDYKTLSPSVLSGIRMVDIKIVDAENESSLIYIESIKLRWNILKLLSDTPTDAFGDLVITGLSADYDYQQHDGIVQKIMSSIQSISSTNEDEVSITESAEPSEQNLQERMLITLEPVFALPIDIQLKNTSLTYIGELFTLQTNLSNIEIFEQNNQEFLNVVINGIVTMTSKGAAANFGTLSTRISFSGHLSDVLDNSFAQMRLSSYQDSDYTIPRLDFYTSFSDNILHAVAMQNVLPFSLEFECDFLSSQMGLTFHAENFDPFSLISYEGDNETIQRLKGSQLSGVHTLSYNWDDENIAYGANGSALIAESLIGESIIVDYAVDGDETILSIDYFDVFSKSISIGYSGSINIQTLIPEGILDIRSITVPSGQTLSSEVYIESLGNELIVFAPQIMLGEKTLTALQLEAERNGNALDFTFEVSDYSRAQTNDPGIISLNGSYDFGVDQFFQVEVLSDSLFLASINEIFLWYLPQEQTQTFALLNTSLAPYIFSFNAFFSTDFESFSYSLPYAIIANTQRDDEFLLFSANGNESLFQVPNLDMLIAGQSIQLEASGDLGDGNSEVFFNSSLFFNSIPYTFSGAYMPAEYMIISGDYDLNINVDFSEEKSFLASVQTQSFPVSLHDVLLSLSLDTTFSYTSSEEWLATINTISVENTSSSALLKPFFNFSGEVSTNGAFFDQVSYSDDISTLEGVLASSWNINNSILENITFNLSLGDVFSNERYEFNIEAFNLAGVAISDSDFFANMFFSADALVQDSPSSRFANFQTETNTINAQLTAQGSLENPSASLIVENSSFQLGPNATEFSGSISLEDFAITANDVNALYGNINFQNINGSISLRDFNGDLDGFIEGRLSDTSYFAEKTFASPVHLSLVSPEMSEDTPLSERLFELRIELEEIASTFLPPLRNYTVEMIRSPGRFDVEAGLNSELTGYILDSGEIGVNATEGFFVQFDAYGIYDNAELTMFIDNIYADAENFSELVDLPVFSLHSGIATGTGTLTGPLNDLQINADLYGRNMEISVPDYVNERLICADFPVTVSQNVFSADNTYFVAQETQTGVGLSVALSMEQLEFTYISLDIDTLEEEFVLGRYEMPYGTFEGFAQTALEIYVSDDIVEVEGAIHTKDIEAIISIAPSDVEEAEELEDIFVDLVITVENQSQLYLPSKNNPIIRGLVNQIEPLIIQMDTRYATSLITGDFDMRGGEILYLNRTFFARDASATFNDSLEDFDPRLTVSAEIRERDENGDTVRIILSVENQRLSQLDPSFESIPSMNEQDIMTLLGQIIIGRSEDASPLALLGGLADYGTQIVVFRGFENQVRDLLNLDLFSFRTMFLQNTIGYALDDTTGETLSVGDFLDGTTIYIGKYLNETLYADAMVSVVFDEERQDLGLGGLVFQPEFGLELPSPFATIRWSIAPDLTTDWDLLVPFTSVSFSWKFNF